MALSALVPQLLQALSGNAQGADGISHAVGVLHQVVLGQCMRHV